ncbi:MAG TPA: ABC transporter permease subunit [Ktedonobacterales bacterium]|nr:ABC transporter permease subunit [Ktedonobacterales bacterium]
MAGKLASSPAPPGAQANVPGASASPTASAEQPPTRHVPTIAAKTTMTSMTNAPNAKGAPNAPSAPDAPDALPAKPTTGATRAHAQRPRWLASAGAIALPTLVGVALLLAWQGATQSGAVSPYLLPTPGAVAQSLLFSLRDGLLTTYGLTTLQESLTGLALGALVAQPLGYALAKSRWIAAALEPYLAATQAVPAVALAPLLVLWLGYGLPPVAALCALIVFFPMVVNTTLGIRRLDRDVLDAARVDGAGRWAFLWRVEAPLAAPVILAGLRTSVTLSVTGAVVGEFVLGDQGLGGLLTIARGSFDTPLVFATLLMLALLTAALYGCARTIEWLYSRWEA